MIIINVFVPEAAAAVDIVSDVADPDDDDDEVVVVVVEQIIGTNDS